jgi:aryl-alcohol dehydrogenase-like predicted oxidoreductase
MEAITGTPTAKSLILGTALWGWGVDRVGAHAMLDQFAADGGRIVDAATNYPINKQIDDNGLSLAWLGEWLAVNKPTDMTVLAKFGGIDNLGTAEPDLTPPAIDRAESLLRDVLGGHLGAMAIHWDNRGAAPEDREAIAATLQAMARLHAGGLAIGFSGVKYPALYQALAPGLARSWWIQVKENSLSQAARLSYQQLFPHAHFIAYGINMGGVKLQPASPGSSVALRGITVPADLTDRLAAFLASDHGLSPRPSSLNELALLTTFLNPALSGVIVGPSSVVQLRSTQRFWHLLATECHAPQKIFDFS